MNVSKHVRERWIERVNPTAGEDANEQVLQAFKSSEYLIDQKDGTAAYVNNDHWLFVYDPRKDCIVTAWEIDFGFPADINRSIAKQLISKVREAKVKLIELEEAQAPRRTNIALQLEGVDNEISHLEDLIEVQKAKRNRLKSAQDELGKEAFVYQEDIKRLANSLINSIAFRKK